MGDDTRRHDLERFLSFVGHTDGELLELRALGGQLGPYYATTTTARDAVRLANERDAAATHGGVYITANTFEAERSAHGWRAAGTGKLAADALVRVRRALVVDVDPDRPPGTSATDAEREAARQVALRVARTLDDALFAHAGEERDAIALGSSGNGWWVLIALDALPETPELRRAVEQILRALDALCSGGGVKIDRTVHNASRIVPAWGTMKRKGGDAPDRPHRRSEMATVPERVYRLSMADVFALRDQLEALVGEAPKAPASPSAPSGDAFKAANGVSIRMVAEALGLNPRGSAKRPVVDCPRGCSGGTSVVLLLEVNQHKCSHNTCADLRWPGLRSAVDLWAEVRGVSPLEAARAVCELGGVAVPPAPTTSTTQGTTTETVAPEPWRWLAEAGPEWLTSAPKQRRWLLSKIDGTGVLPLGKVGMFAAAGGVGKTMALTQLALAVASGRAWLNTYTTPNPGAVLLALAEEDAEEMQRRLFNAARMMELTAEETALAARRVVVLPLAGQRVALVQGEGGEVKDTLYLEEMRTRLATMRDPAGLPVEWRLIILDPLSRWAGADTEKDNAAATRFVEAAETIALKAPGGPTVLVAHHTSKASRVDGADGNATAPRGVTGLVDGVRWVAEMDDARAEGEAASIECVKLRIPSKSNYSRLGGQPLLLVRDRDHGGALRPPSEDEAEAIANAREAQEAGRTASKKPSQEPRKKRWR